MYTIDEIKELAKAVSEYKLEKLKLKTDEYEIVIEGTAPQPVQIMQSAAAPYVPAIQEAVPAINAEPTEVAADTSAKKEEAPVGNIVKAPLVGTFYSSASPDDEPYVKVGDTVKKGDVLMIIESMKLMNEVTSDFDGVVDEILVSNGEAVEYDQPIMRIR